MIKYLDPKEIVILSFSSPSLELLYSSSPPPLYVASADGIYKITNTSQILSSYKSGYGRKTRPLLVIYIIIVVAIAAFVVIEHLSYYINSSITNVFIITVFMAFLFMAVYAIIMSSREYKKALSNNLLGELVVLWSEISRIDVINVRQVQRTPNPNSGFGTFGDWRVITYDGREIIVPRVEDPTSKLRKVKKKFNLSF